MDAAIEWLDSEIFEPGNGDQRILQSSEAEFV